jgi:hypothetical protein
MLSGTGDRNGGGLWTAAGLRVLLDVRLMNQPLTGMCRLR